MEQAGTAGGESTTGTVPLLGVRPHPVGRRIAKGIALAGLLCCALGPLLTAVLPMWDGTWLPYLLVVGIVLLFGAGSYLGATNAVTGRKVRDDRISVRLPTGLAFLLIFATGGCLFAAAAFAQGTLSAKGIGSNPIVVRAIATTAGSRSSAGTITYEVDGHRYTVLVSEDTEDQHAIVAVSRADHSRAQLYGDWRDAQNPSRWTTVGMLLLLAAGIGFGGVLLTKRNTRRGVAALETRSIRQVTAKHSNGFLDWKVDFEDLDSFRYTNSDTARRVLRQRAPAEAIADLSAADRAAFEMATAGGEPEPAVG